MSAALSPIEWLDAALRGGFVALMLLLTPRLWRAAAVPGGDPAPEGRLGAALALGSAVYALQSALLARGPLQLWQAPLQAVATGNPVVVLLLAWALFDDAFVLRRWHGLAWWAWVTLALGNCYGWRSLPLGIALELAPMGFALAALWPVLRHWRDDLVESRLKLRGRIVLGVVGYTLLSTAAGLPASGAGAPAWLRLSDAALLLGVGLAAAWPLLVLAPGGLLRASPALRQPLPSTPSAVPDRLAVAPDPGPAGEPPAVAAPRGALDAGLAASPVSAVDGSTNRSAADDADAAADALALQRLQRAMAERQPWRREGLTIGRLADDLGLPEYRLRQVINRRLGHRNFNVFLNGHRIADVKAALADPARSDVPVLTLALEAGFQSLGPFNRAFKADTGLTPSEFRRQAQEAVGTARLSPVVDGSPNPAIAG